MCRLLTLLALAFLTIVSVPSPRAQAQATTPAFEAQGLISGATEVKYPHVAAFGSNVYVSSNINRAEADMWGKQDVAPAFGAAETLGIAEGQPDYSTTSITTGPDGAVYYAWVNQTTRLISLRVKRPGQRWTQAITVGSGAFPVFPEVAATSDGYVFVAWRNPDHPFMFRRSADGGATWGAVQTLSDGTAVNVADFAVGPQGQLAVAYMGGESDHLQIYVAAWNGVSFTKARVTSLNGDYADPSTTYTPDGRLIVAWRGVADRGSTSGVFYAERQASGTFVPARLIGGGVQGRVNIEGDQASNLHMVWNVGNNVWYSVKPAGGAWTSPVQAAAGSGTIFNIHAAVSAGTGNAIYAHAVAEVFIGSNIYLRFFRFRSGLTAGPVLSARPVLEQGATTTRASSLGLGFADVSGTPAEVRYHWGSAPTDADIWQPFASQMTVAAPSLASTDCAQQTLYTQVRTASGIVQTSALSATVQLDQAVQANVAHYPEKAALGYTNRPVMGVLVADAGECSGFATIRPVISSVEPMPFTASPYLLGIDITDQPGRYERGVELTDKLGNTASYTVAVTYDPIAPTAAYTEALQIALSKEATILQTIGVGQAFYRDDEGSDVLPWAVAILVSREPIAADVSAQAWTLVPLGNRVGWSRSQQAESTLAAQITVNIAELLPRDQLTPGDYYYALALVDRAGNASAEKAVGTFTLESVTFFRNNLPLVRR
jgi:hypothetical protein